MALEDLTGTKYIDDLVSTNPAAGDNVSEGDDHIRGIKNVLKTTFPSIDGAVTATQAELNVLDGVTSTTAELNILDGVTATAAELNHVDGVTSNVQTQINSVSTTASAALPKAGGTMTGDLILGDNVKLEIGSASGGDLQLYHDGSHSYVTNPGTGDLVIRGDDVKIQGSTGGEIMIQAVEDGDVKLYHNNLERLATTATGVTATGNINVTSSNHVGISANDSILWNAGNHTTFNCAGGEQMRLRSTGDLHCEGDVIAYSTTISDATLKYDINPVEFALDKINQLKGVSYKYKHNDRESAGLLAQDVEKVMPSAVSTKTLPLATGTDKEYKTLHYDSMTAILVEAIKELTAKVKKLENK